MDSTLNEGLAGIRALRDENDENCSHAIKAEPRVESLEKVIVEKESETCQLNKNIGNLDDQTVFLDFNVLFSNGFSEVGNRILRYLPYDTIKTCEDVSPEWKNFISQQKSWRLRHLLSLINSEWERSSNLEWKKIIPEVKNQMSVSDIDTLIKGLTLYIEMDPSSLDFGEEIDVADYWSPMHWAFHEGNFKFIEVMIRTPYDFNSITFPMLSCDFGTGPKSWGETWGTISHTYWGSGKSDVHGNCCTYDLEYEPYDDEIIEHFVEGNNVLHKAARDGHADIVQLILKFAEEKKIDINAKNDNGDSAMFVAKNNPKIVRLLMKHCKYSKKSLKKLGAECLASIMLPSDDEEPEEPAKKKIKRGEESDESVESEEHIESEEPVESDEDDSVESDEDGSVESCESE